MDLEIKGHVAVVTGGGRGLGAAMAVALAEEGCKVVAWDRDDSGGEVAARIRAAGGDALAVTGDVTDPGAVGRTVAQVLERLGLIEILVNS